MNKLEQLKYLEDNYPLYTNHISNRKIRHDFFSNIETELQAYLLGFYTADGSINEKRKTLRIHLQLSDIDLVNLYKDVISPDARTYEVEPKAVVGRNGAKVFGHGSFGVDITSAKLCNDLVNLGVGYRKSYEELHIPKALPDNLIIHFIRGYFDGDGSVSGGVYSDKYRPNPRVRIHCTIDAKKATLLQEFMEYFAKIGIQMNLNYLTRDDMYRLQTSSKGMCKKLFDVLYADSNFYLKRKFDKFNYYVNTEVSQIITDHCNAQKLSVNESDNTSTSAEHPTNEGGDIC